MSPLADPLPLARALLRCRSVTPADDGAQDVLAEALASLGFSVRRLPFGTTPNLYARLGEGRPALCFAGHTDVVPAGEGWAHGAFAAEVSDGALHGRGAVDMKGAIACFVAATARRIAAGMLRGAISLLVTGDEEGSATDGTVRVLDWMAGAGEIPDACLVGEPTNPGQIGEVVKIGRRGSLNAEIVVPGTQGHVAYPHRADNPLHRLVPALGALLAERLDEGSEWFEPSSLQITAIETGNPATNVIPAAVTARCNIRFNDLHTGASLEERLRRVLAAHVPAARLSVSVSGEAFRTAPGPFVDALRRAVQAGAGVAPRLDTGGGTSDARFVARHCPVAEFGLSSATMHRADEHVPLTDLETVTRVYRHLLDEVGA